MVAQRKRSASLLGSSSDESDESAADRPAPNGQAKSTSPPPKAASISAKLVPFQSGADFHQALKTPSADLLRLLLSRFRAQTSLSFAEDQERSLVSASDRRLELVKDYCQLCMTDASNSTSSSAAASTIFSTWDLADKQNLPTLLHLPIFALAQTLALLSIHYPTQVLGEAIIDRILAPNEPWFGRLQTYISNLGGAKLASGKTRDANTKGSDVSALAALVLLREINSFARGKYAGKVFDSFNWGMKVLPHIFSMRRRSQQDRKKARKMDHKSVANASLRRPDIRTLYILFLLSFLVQSYSSSLKVRLLELGRDFLPALLKGLSQDPADVVQVILVHLHEDLVKDDKISRSKKIEFWNEWACECVVKLYAREDDHVVVHTGAEVGDTPSVAELAHHFLLSICTNPGFGICYPDRGWYPRKAAQDEAALERTESAAVDSLLPADDIAPVSGSSKKVQQGGTIHNKVLSGVLRQLSVTEDLRQQELALSILQACPELVGPYLESSCAGLSVEPRPSSRWLCNIAFFGRVVGLDLPSFRKAKVERLENGEETKASSSLDFFPVNPPPMQTILSNLLPGPFCRFLFSQGISSSDRLVQYSTCALLSGCLRRMAQFRALCEDAIETLDEGSEGPWRKRLLALEIEARKRLPDVSVVIQILQNATGGQAARSASRARASTVDSDASTSLTSPGSSNNALSTEVALRLLWLFYLAVPSSSHDIRFNAGKLLSNSFMLSATKVSNFEVAEDAEVLNLRALCQVHTLRILSLSSDTVFDWTAKANVASSSGSNLSYFGLLLCLFVSTPLDQVRESCEALLRKILSTSALFEHNVAEVDVWLSSLPQADRLQDPNRQPVQHQMLLETDLDVSQEQIQVITFIDECVLRGMKTPYRYIEEARENFAIGTEMETKASGHHKYDAADATSASMLASPLLMVLYGQCSIRINKGLFDIDTLDALLAFFARLLPCASAYTLNSPSLAAMADELHTSVLGNTKYERSIFKAKVITSRMRAIVAAPQVTPSSKLSKGNEPEQLKLTSSPKELRSALRSMERPLSEYELVALYDAVERLSSEGFDQACEIFDELDPTLENLSVSRGTKHSINAQTLPILHVATGHQIADNDANQFMTTDEHKRGFPGTVSWESSVQCRLVIWTAMSRVRHAAVKLPLRSGPTLDQAGSMLRYVVESSVFFDQEDIQSYLFAEVTPIVFDRLKAIPSAAKLTADCLEQICAFAAELDPTRESHRQLLVPIIRTLLADSLWESTAHPPCLTAISAVAPYMDVESALQLADKLLASLRISPSPATLDLLRMLLALFSQSDVLFTKVSQHAVDMFSSGRADSSVIGLLHDLLSRNGCRRRSALKNAFTQGMQMLLSFGVPCSNRDGSIVGLIQLDNSYVDVVSISMVTHLHDSGGAAELLQNVPYSICAVLEALVSRTVEQSPWNEEVLRKLVQTAVSMINSVPGTANSSTVLFDFQPIVTVIKHAVDYAQSLKWPDIGRTATSGVLSHVAACSPREAFSEPVMQLAITLVSDKPQLPQLTEMTQKIVDQALLWLVRRFAEDDNDSRDLVHSITLLKKLIQKATTSLPGLQLSSHLVDPVVQAAIKNRLSAVQQLELVVILCTSSELGISQLSRYLGAISAHAAFNSIMRDDAIVLFPLTDDEDSTADINTASTASRLRDVVIELIHTLAVRDGKALLHLAFVTKLMTFYGASLRASDRQLLNLFRLYEEEGGQPFKQLASQWSLPSSKVGGVSNSATFIDALVSLDSNTVFATCTEYPRCLPLKKSTASGYADHGNQSIPGQMYGKHADLAQRYDPVFLASLLAGAIGTQKLTGLEWLAVLATNVPGLVMCGLSSQYADMRQASFALLCQCYTSVEGSNFHEKEHLLMVFDLLRNAALSGVDHDTRENDQVVTPVMPMTTTLFVAHSLRSLASPSSFVYPAISHFMLQRPVLDVGDVPMLYSFLYSASDRYRQERIWMLRFLRDVSRSGGRSDWKIMKRRHTWELLASLYDSSMTSLASGTSSERATEEAAVRALIEDTMFWLARHGDIATELVTRRNILSWIWQQLIRDGVVSQGLTTGSPLRETWILLVAQLISHADLDRLDRATSSLWRSSVNAIVSASLRAIQRSEIHNAEAAASTITVTTEKTSFIIYASAIVMEKLIWHSVSSEQAKQPTNEVDTPFCSSSAAKHLQFSMIESVTILLQLSNQWLNSLDNAQRSATVPEQLANARRCCKRVQDCILGLEASSLFSQNEQLARMLRESVETCKSFDSETRSLLLTSLHTTVK